MLIPEPRTATTAKTKMKIKRITLVVGCLGLTVLAWIAFRTVRGLVMFGYVDSAIFRVREIAAAENQVCESASRAWLYLLVFAVDS